MTKSKLIQRLEQLSNIPEGYDLVDEEIHSCLTRHKKLVTDLRQRRFTQTLNCKDMRIVVTAEPRFEKSTIELYATKLSFRFTGDLTSIFGTQYFGHGYEPGEWNNPVIPLSKLLTTRFGKDPKLTAILTKFAAQKREYDSLTKNERDIIRYELEGDV